MKAGRPGDVLDLAAYTDFPWTRLYVFSPYTPLKTSLEKLGVQWPSAFVSSIESSDSRCLLIFIDGKRVRAALEYPRQRGDFSQLPAGKAYSPQDAMFKIEQRKNDSWPMMVPWEGKSTPLSSAEDAVGKVMHVPAVQEWIRLFPNGTSATTGGHPAFSVVSESSSTFTVWVYEDLPERAQTFAYYSVQKKTGAVDQEL